MRSIRIEEGGWICAGSILLPGTVVGREAIVSAGSVTQGEIPERAIVRGNPAVKVGDRVFVEQESCQESGENTAETRENERT